MIRASLMQPARKRQRGVILISTMLLLLVLTIFALGMFRSFGLQQRIAGNVREKQRALQNAEGAQQYAESWLSNLTTTTPAKVPCAAVVMVTAPSVVQICSNALTSALAATVPWAAGFRYNPPTGLTVNAAMTAGNNYGNSYADYPQFYISDLGVSADATGEIYQIDAWGYAASNSTVAVVESTYLVKPTVRCLSC